MRLNKSKLISLSILITVVFLILWITPLNTLAAWWDSDNNEAVDFLQKHSEWLQFGSFFPVIMHELGWLLIRGLFAITSFLEGLIPETLNLLTFLEDAGLNSISNAIINDLVVVLMVLTLVFLGFKTVVAKEPPNFKSVGVNVFISAFLILGLPTLMATMQDISVKFYDATQKGNNNGQVASLSWGLIQDNTADLVYASDKGFYLIENGGGDGAKNALTPEKFRVVNLSELITPDAIDDLETDNSDLESLKYTLSIDGQGEYTASEISGSMLSFFSDNFESGYFRYPAKFFPIIVGLVALSVAYLFTVFIFVTTIIEIGIKRIVGLFVFATDLESGQRTKMVVQDILNAFMLIAFTGLSLRMYTLFLTYLGTQDLNIMIYLIALVSATFVMIKGSNTIMRYFGVDVGLKDGFAQMAGAFALGKTVSDLAAKKPGSGSPKNGQKTTKDQLSEQGESEAKSINNQSPKGITHGLKSGLNNVGKSLGYMQERGIAGLAEDSIKGTGEKISNNLSNKGKAITNTAQGIKDSWQGGLEEGVATGKANNEKWNGKEKSINELDNENGLNQGINATSGGQNNDFPGAQGSLRQQQNIDANVLDSTNGSMQQDMLQGNNLGASGAKGTPLNEGQEKITTPSGTSNVPLTQVPTQGNTLGASGVNVTPLNQDVQQNITGSSGAAHAPLRQDVIQGNNLGASGTNGTPLNQDVQQNITGSSGAAHAPLRQDVIQGNNLGASGTNVTPLNQDVQQNITGSSGTGHAPLRQDQNGGSTTQGVVQKVIQQVERTPFTNPETAKQSIIQQVQQASFGTNDIKQNIIQDINKSSTATPQQMKQNIEQVLTSAKLPQQAQSTVQRVIQEVQNNPSASTESIKRKVIQELEGASFGTKEPIKQAIIQDIQKAFSATPEQMQQNIKQVMQNAQTSGAVSSEQVQQTIKQVIDKTENTSTSGSSQENKSGYFDSLFGEVPNNYPNKVTPKKASRFDFIKS